MNASSEQNTEEKLSNIGVSSRDPMISSSSSVKTFFDDRQKNSKGSDGGTEEGKVSFFTGESVLAGIKRIYGLDLTIIDTIKRNELRILLKYADIVELMSDQKVFHAAGFIREFGNHRNDNNEFIEGIVPTLSQYTFDKVKDILARNNLLIDKVWSGESKHTWGMVLWMTPDCTPEMVQNYLKPHTPADRLRKIKEEQRTESAITHNKRMKEDFAKSVPKPGLVVQCPECESSMEMGKTCGECGYSDE